MILTKRHRVSVSISVKGVVTPDQSVEITAQFAEDEEPIDLIPLVLQETAVLHAALAAEYPTVSA